MGPLLVLLQNPEWWYESWGVRDWLGTLFNQPLEVHTFLLGLVLGVLLATLTATRRPRTALTFTLVVVLFTFGAFETVVVCSDAFSACQHVRLKPWYFIGGFMAAHLGGIGIMGRGGEEGTTDDDRRATSLLAGFLIIALLGFAGYSFVAPRPVHPITGLATVGGLLGSALGYAAFLWAIADEDDGYVTTFGRTLRRRFDETVLIVGYGSVFGFGYPRLFWELGAVAGRPEFLFGPILWARNGLPSVAAYVFVLFLVTVVFSRIREEETEVDRPPGQRFAALVLGFVVYAFCLFVATGYAGLLWFRVTPSV